MENQKLQLLHQTQVGKPINLQEKFLIKRIDEDAIEISLTERDAILTSLDRGDRFIQIRKHTLMLNAIKSIDPKFGEENIPPRPRPVYEFNGARVDYQMEGGRVVNQEEVDEWDRYFK